MKVIRTIDEMRSFSETCSQESQRIGLVPTMGALHEGHMALVREARDKSDVIVASIFVNPLQFNNPEDLKKYPRDEQKDLLLLKTEGCSAVFIPEAPEFYPDQANVLSIDFGDLTDGMEGQHRPGHFSGVGVVLGKLFHCINPQMAFFGKKDIQQLAVVRKLVKDLNFPLEIIGVETVRDENGLALSSRNQLLGGQEKVDASSIYRSLKALVDGLKNGTPIETVKKGFVDSMDKFSNFSPEYIEVVDEFTMQPVDSIEDSGSFAACTAVMVNGVRLIDNITF